MGPPASSSFSFFPCVCCFHYGPSCCRCCCCRRSPPPFAVAARCHRCCGLPPLLLLLRSSSFPRASIISYANIEMYSYNTYSRVMATVVPKFIKTLQVQRTGLMLIHRKQTTL